MANSSEGMQLEARIALWVYPRPPPKSKSKVKVKGRGLQPPIYNLGFLLLHFDRLFLDHPELFELQK